MSINVYPNTPPGTPSFFGQYVISSGAWSTNLATPAYNTAGYEWPITQTLPAGVYYAQNGWRDSNNTSYPAILPRTDTTEGIYIPAQSNSWGDEYRLTTSYSSYKVVVGTRWNNAGSGSVVMFSGVNGVAYGNNYFVAVSNDTTAAISTDGSTWTSQAVPGLSRQNVLNSSIQSSLTFQNGFFMYANAAGRGISISTNATTWVTRAVVTSNQAIIRIVYGNTYYLAATAATVNYRSTDLVTWTTVPITPGGNSASPKALQFLNAFFIAPTFETGSGNGQIYISTDASTWTTRAVSASPTAVMGLGAYGNGLYVLPDVTNNAQVAISSNMSTWTLANTPSTLTAVYFDSPWFYGQGYNSNTFGLSTDGLNWYRADVQNISPGGAYIAVVNNRLIVIGLKTTGTNVDFVWTTNTIKAGVIYGEVKGTIEGYKPTVLI